MERYSNYLQKLEQEIAQRTSFMNNSKWFKLFAKIKTQQLFFRSASIKFLLNDGHYSFLLDGFNANGFDDVGVTGPFLYKEIEWIELKQKHEVERWNRTEKLSSEIIIQPLDEAEDIMTKLGQFEYERSEDKLIIYGYK